MSQSSEPVHIIGSGITGLGSAHYLSLNDKHSVIYECSDSVGGRAGCIQKDGHILELGGKNFSSGWKLFNALLADYSISNFDKQHPNFSILLNGKLVKLNKRQTLAGDLSVASALGLRGSFQFKKLFSEASNNCDKLERSGTLLEQYEQRYDNRPISEQFARNLAYGPLRMFSIISGAAEPDEVYYSNILAFMAGFAKGSHHAIAGGIGQLFNRMAENREIQFNTKVEKILVENRSVTGLRLKTAQGSIEIPASKIITTIPIHELKKIMDFPTHVRQEVDRIRYYPVVLINAIYDGDVFTDEINSIMFDETFHLGHCSANRAYQKNHIRFTISGRKARDIMEWSDSDLIDLAEQEFGSIHPIDANRIFLHVARHPGGLCAYAPFYSRIRNSLLDYVSTIDGLEIAGDYLDGHAMGECLISSWNAVNNMLKPQ